MTGYELVQLFDQSMNWVWSAPQSQIYPRLREMEERGLIDGRKEIRGEKLERTVYSLTDTGFEELVRWVADASDSAPQRDALLLQAVFFDMVDPDSAVAVLERFIAEQEELIEQWAEHRDRLAAKDTPLIRERLRHRPAAEHDRVAALKAHVFDGKVAVAKARVAWAQRGIELLRERSARPAAAVSRDGR